MSAQVSARIRRTTLVGSVTIAVALGGAPIAAAAPGDWTQLSTFSNAVTYPHASNIDQPTMARFDSSLQVIWPAQTSSSTQSYLTAVLDGAGRVTSASREIVSGWATLTENPVLIGLAGQRFLAFSGLQSTTTGAPFTSGSEYYATSPDGVTFTPSSGSLSATTSAYAAYSNDVIDNAGTPVWVGSAGSTTGINWHVGTSPSQPAPAGSDGQFRLAGCCAYSAALGRDEATGAVYAAFYSNSEATTEQGIQVGQILPTQGAFAQAPGSIIVRDGAADSLGPDQRVAMAARSGGGVYVAYAVGYPTATSIRVLKVGTSSTLDVPGSAGARNISMGSGPDGRLWVSWVSGNRLKVVHTNASATRFGAVGNWGAPRGTATMWKSAIEGFAGGADVVVTATTSSEINVWHSQALRTLGVSANRKAVRRGSPVTLTVTDAGDPVAGAHVRLGARSGTTNAAGKVTLRAPGSSGRAKVTAKKAAYNAGVTTVLVR